MNHSTDATGSQEATEAKSLAARLIEHADAHAPLITGFADEGETELAAAFGGAALAFRSLAAALDAGEDTSRALGQLDAASARVRAALDAARAN